MWQARETILRREVLNDGRCWAEFPVVVVRDEPKLLATYIPEGTPFTFHEGEWPVEGGRHPWAGRERWTGHGALMLQRPNDAYAVWVFWHGPERAFHGWYLNLQDPFRRTVEGYDTQDHELDIWVPANGAWMLKDDELLDVRVREGRFTQDQARAFRAEADRITAELDAGRRWWDDAWASWQPQAGGQAPSRAAGTTAIPSERR